MYHVCRIRSSILKLWPTLPLLGALTSSLNLFQGYYRNRGPFWVCFIIKLSFDCMVMRQSEGKYRSFVCTSIRPVCQSVGLPVRSSNCSFILSFPSPRQKSWPFKIIPGSPWLVVEQKDATKLLTNIQQNIPPRWQKYATKLSVKDALKHGLLILKKAAVDVGCTISHKHRGMESCHLLNETKTDQIWEKYSWQTAVIG